MVKIESTAGARSQRLDENMTPANAEPLRVVVIMEDAEMRRNFALAIRTTGNIPHQLVSIHDLHPSIERGVHFDRLIIAVPGPKGKVTFALKEAKQLLGPAPTLFLAAKNQLECVGDFLSWSPANRFVPLSSAKANQDILALLNIPSRSWKVSKSERFGQYTLHSDVQSVAFDSKNVRLKKREFAVARHLFLNQSRIISRAELLEKVWAKDILKSTRTVDTHVCRIRKMLELAAEHGVVLNAVHGVGYQLRMI